jgi:hypothetical protein
MKTYYVLLLSKESSPKFHNFLLPRLLDQVSVLSQLELEVRTLARSGEKGLSSWIQLPKGKLDLLANCVEVCVIILKIHRLLLKKHHKAGTLESQGKIFWTSFGYL